eukprot:1395132-Amorphochlora_amoeboformis.AAC.3
MLQFEAKKTSMFVAQAETSTSSLSSTRKFSPTSLEGDAKGMGVASTSTHEKKSEDSKAEEDSKLAGVDKTQPNQVGENRSFAVKTAVFVNAEIPVIKVIFSVINLAVLINLMTQLGYRQWGLSGPECKHIGGYGTGA